MLGGDDETAIASERDGARSMGESHLPVSVVV
jgi:hypothetical protein